MALRRRILWRDIKLGIVITIAAVLLAFGIVAVGGSGSGFWVPKETYYTDFPNASGLYVGSLVMIDGVEVGTVRAIHLKPEGRGVRIEFKVARNVIDRIRTDSVVSVENLGLLGDRYLNIRSGNPAKDVVPPGSVLPGKPGSDYNEIFASFSASIPDIQKTIRELASLTEKLNRGEGFIGTLLSDPEMAQNLKKLMNGLANGEGSLGKLLRDDELYQRLNRLVARLESHDSTLGVLLSDPESAENLKATLTALRNLATKLDQGEGSIGKLIQDPSLFDELKKLSQRSNDLLEKIQSKESSLGMLVNDRELYDRITASVTDLQSLLQEIRKHPKKYLSVKVGLIAF